MRAAAFDELAARGRVLERLPLVTLYLSERCNSRCLTCDYWRHGAADLDLEAVRRLLPDLARLGTRKGGAHGQHQLIVVHAGTDCPVDLLIADHEIHDLSGQFRLRHFIYPTDDEPVVDK